MICFRASSEMSSLTRVKKSCARYLYTNILCPGTVSQGNRKYGLLGKWDQIFELKLSKISFGVSFKIKLSRPDL
jgi:hypothetical protein